MNKRKLSKERVEEMESVFSKLKTFEFVPVSVGSIKDLIHDLELADEEIKLLGYAKEEFRAGVIRYQAKVEQLQVFFRKMRLAISKDGSVMDTLARVEKVLDEALEEAS